MSRMLRTTLPRPRTPLLGRDAELTAIRQRLVQERAPLLTLTGPDGTVNAHVASILRRLEVLSRQEAVQLARQRGLLPDETREPPSDLHNPSQETLSERTPRLQDMRHSIDGVA